MNKNKQKQIVASLKLIINTASNGGTLDHRGLARHSKIVLDALNLLFETQGLETVEYLFGE